jgi:tripartite-type tricarboxylate transporter receptor subunit TctC
MSGWTPSGALQIIAGTPPGGGLDRVARALAKAIEAARLVNVPLEVVNVPGGGARKAWTQVIDKRAGDAHVVAISSPNLTTDYLVGAADFEHSKYTAIATLVTEYIAFAVRADSTLRSGRDLLARFRQDAAGVTVALSTALGNPNHIALAKLVRQAGGDVSAPAIRVFDSALDCVADVVAGQADVCAVTAASVIAELNPGRLRVLAISARVIRRAGEILGKRHRGRDPAAVLDGRSRTTELVAAGRDRRAFARSPRPGACRVRRRARRVGAAQTVISASMPLAKFFAFARCGPTPNICAE